MKRQQQYIKALSDKVFSCIENDDTFLLNLADKLDKYVLYDSTNQRMLELLKKYKECKFTGITDIEGEFKLGEEYMEFYPDEESIIKTVIDLFYTEKTDK